MKKLVAVMLVLVLCAAFVACGNKVDKQPAIDAMNEAGVLYNEVAEAVNADPDTYGEEAFTFMQELGDELMTNQEWLLSDEEITQEQLDELIAWYGDVVTRMTEIKDAYGIG